MALTFNSGPCSSVLIRGSLPFFLSTDVSVHDFQQVCSSSGSSEMPEFFRLKHQGELILLSEFVIH